jgi:alcohol-forming fatty acyl-CoA reductase
VPIADDLAGRRTAVTGVTGFVGQALLAQLLAHVPDVELVLLARAGSAGSTEERMATLLRHASAFDRVRRGDPGLTATLARLHVVDADLERTDLELPPIDTLLHVAGTVSFDVPIDEAFRTHATGVDALYRAARAAGCTHVVHVSTAYVAARQPGPVPEDATGDGIDWRAEARAADELAASAELTSRQPARLERFVADARAEVGAHGDGSVAAEAERARRAWVRDQLVAAGRQRAHSLGFSDVYTLTKAAGERVARERFGDRRLTIVRPTIVESALRDPAPGWIEGFKVADPIIVGLGRGDIPDFPGFPDGVVDVVPVDFVANAIVAAAASPPPEGTPRHLVVGTGARNPLTLHRMYQLVRDHFERHPLPGRDGHVVRPPAWRFAGPDLLEWQLRTATSVAERAERALRRVPLSGDGVRRAGRSLGRHRGRLQTLGRFLELYGAYAQVESVFLDDTAEALRAAQDPADRDRFGFDPAELDWTHYLQELHVPAVTAPLRLLAGTERRTGPTLPPVRTDDDAAPVLAVFDLDGTVASTNVITTYLQARWHDDRLDALRETVDIARGLPRYLSLDATGRERFLRAFYRRFAGVDVAALDRLVTEVLSDALLHDLTPAAVRRIRAHRAAGHRTVLLTGALRSFCEPLRPLFDTIAAAELEVDGDGQATGHLLAPPLVGATRAAWLRHHARAVGADLTRSYAYADSRSDVPLLRCVGHAVAVDPDVALHRLARRERWTVVAWRGADGTAPARAGDPLPGAAS